MTTIHPLNVLRCELDDSLSEAGFQHAAASIGDRLGARRVGAGLYEAVAERPIWPYHYHYSSEEWLYVISGAPVLREAAGRRALTPGDLVCFPSNHRGAHTVCGPGRFIIFSTKGSPGPWVSVYPDSDKISISPGWHESTDLNSLILPRESRVDYWHREGDGTAAVPPPRSLAREPPDAAGLTVINALTTPTSRRALALGGVGLSATVLELGRGECSEPYHYEYGRETWVLVLLGTPTLRHPGGVDVLRAGDLVCFPEGPDGARELINHERGVVRAVLFSTTGFPANVCYADSGTWILRNGRGDAITVRATDDDGGQSASTSV